MAVSPCQTEKLPFFQNHQMRSYLMPPYRQTLEKGKKTCILAHGLL